MQVLREISSQTAESTTATSTSIGKLAELATQLRKSVTGFRLPGGPGTSVTADYPVLRPQDVPPEDADRPRRVSGLPG
jgi:twitching motility protein PilJ